MAKDWSLESLPGDFFHFQLEEVNLDGNKGLKTLPPIASSSSLKKLWAQNCSLESLPSNLFQCQLEEVYLVGNKELTYLPEIPSSSPLKRLNADDCSIQSIHPSILRPALALTHTVGFLRNNKIEELPQKEMLEFLERGGDMRELNNNPLVYPPKHVFDEGKDAVIKYLTNYTNTMINAEEVTIILIGRQEAGKTSLGQCLAGKITSSIEIKVGDRTQVFDVYEVNFKGIKIKIIDLGGHKEYESALAVLCRDQGLHICLLNPDDFKDDATLDEGAWMWVEKILDGANSPHFLFVVSKIDMIEEDVRKSKIEEMKSQLMGFLDERMGKPLKLREEREKRMREKIDEVEADIEALGKGNPEELTKLKEQKNNLKRKLSNQVHKVRNPPKFNPDCISFVSSYNQEGFDTFASNLETAISNLPKIMLQEKWREASDWLLNQNRDKPYIKLEDLQTHAPSLSEYDITQMLKAYCARGSIIWHDGSTVIFHRIEKLAVVMKSLFYHGMELLLLRFVEFQNLQPDDSEWLFHKYKDGQLPLPLIKSIFVHLHKELNGSTDGLGIGFDHLDFKSSNSESEILMESLLAILCHMNIITLMDEKILGMEMYLIPHLVFNKADGMDIMTFIEKYTTTSAFVLALCFTLDTKVCKRTFAKNCSVTMSIMKRLASIIEEHMIFHIRENAIVVKAGYFEVAAYTPPSQNHNQFKFMVKVTDDDILHDVGWILLNDISSKVDLQDEECQLVCPRDDPDCDHGDYDPQPTFHGDALEDDSRNKRKRMKKIECDPKFCFPSRLAIKIMNVFHPEQGPCQSPLLIEQDTKGDAHANFLETSNILVVIATQSVEKASMEETLQCLPAFYQNNGDKYFKFVRPLRQYFDDISQCPHNEKCRAEKGCKRKEGCKCQCYLLSEKYTDSFTLLERNSAIVTKGEWTKPLKKILAKHPNFSQEFKENSCSATAMIRVARNLVAHEKSEVQDDQFWSEFRAEFDWFIMHCWACRILLSLSENATLLEFAKAFIKIETKAYNDDKSLIPSMPLLRTTIIKLNGSKKESAFYFDLAEQQKKNPKESDELEFLRLKVVDVFQLSKNFQGKVIYKGPENADPPAEVELTSPTHISELSLDTRVIHLFHISEWEIMVKVETMEETIESTFCSSDPFLEVEKFVRDKMEEQKLLLFNGKAKVSSSASVGSQFKSEFCELKALDPKDPAQKAKLLV